MKPNEIRAMSEGEILAEVDKRRRELFDLRIQSAVGHASNPRRTRAAKREIARFLTIAVEKSNEKSKESR